VDVYLAIVGIVTLLAGVIILVTRVERGQCRALEQEARQLGFSFMSVAKPFEGFDVHELVFCLPEGSSTQAERLVQGTICDCRMLVFNLRAYSSLGEGSIVTTFAAFQSRSSQLPVFQIRVKGTLDRCRDALAGNVVDSHADPKFAKRFCLCCANDTEKHRFFTRSKLLHLLQCADRFQIQSSPDWLLMFRPGRMVSTRNLRQFVNVTSKIAFGLLDLKPQLGAP
jgi:hypothetical protein